MLDSKKRAVIALGFFDGVHLGHQKVISSAKNLAEKLDAITVAFTFSGNLKSVFKSGEKNVYDYNERIFALYSVGVNEILSAPLTSDFLSLSATEFLEWLDSKYQIVGYVSGDDYRFGKGGIGDVKFLTDYANKTGREVVTCAGVNFNGERVSSTLIKEYLASGNVKKASALLGRLYSVTGNVFKDREVGKTLGFPTVNIEISENKSKLKDGVYAGKITLNDREYYAIINYGARPTFSLDKKLIEAHIIGYNGNLYGQKITLEFTDFIRSIKKFENREELISQLEKDAKETGAGKYD